ncbi:flagellin N-terminal helical domain-containing protein [Puniceibacterium confluentis]|uniref:flagellin N-terminal helical domain-containing protein n=1 Tax=Puniceibacterium confluentis TaxID=1958944 RepID=UPI0035653577
MSSILTNNGAMVALQTLKNINSNLGRIQSQISTGKSVANAKDNAAVWAISKVMESDVKGFKGISDSLNLGESTVSVARQASETVTDLLTQMKGKIVAAQEANVDRAKIQTDVAALRDQITSVVGAAQFNGLNLLSNTESDAAAPAAIVGSRNVDILSSLDRSGTGVAASNISVAKQDLGIGANTLGTMSEEVGATATVAAGATATYATFAEDAATGILAGNSFGFTAVGIVDSNGDAVNFDAAGGYVARDGDTLTDVANQMVARLNVASSEAGLKLSFSVNADTEGQIDVTNNRELAIDIDIANVTQFDSAAGVDEADGTVGGGLELVANIDVTTNEGAEAALNAIESLIQTSIDSASNFGSAQGRIETQADFITSLSDSLKSGIGTLVDADMEEASARLQALQVQQQLGVQALSIANQAPQSLLSLFR